MRYLTCIFPRTPGPVFVTIGLLLACIAYSSGSAQTAEDGTVPRIEVEYVSKTNLSLAELAAGAVGDGRILYFVKNGDQRSLRLLVHLYRDAGMTTSIAEVYEVPANLDPYADTLPLAPSDAAIIIEALDGWWVRDNHINYNLDVETRSPIYSMWGSEEWIKLLAMRKPAANIQIRDVDRDGVPDWDLRRMIPAFYGRYDYRVNYAERMCPTPETIDRGVSPEWPYIAFTGHFEQEPGHFRPPVVVDWQSGAVKFFSEVVTVRNQNCSYAIYSIAPIEQDQLNHPDFETPFAFYDLSGEGSGYPNLILRAQRYYPDKSVIGENVPEYEAIRYSWRTAPGDWRWDYKIDVVGLYSYDFETPIAGGLATIDAPSYEVFPSWVVSRAWPVVTFVDPEDANFLSSEGIYAWSAMATSSAYYTGIRDEASTSGFRDITTGFRGEYRLQHANPPGLYFSPIDNRLHLTWAEHGFWRLDEAQIIRLDNLDDDEYMDVWSKEAMAEAAEDKAVPRMDKEMTGTDDAAAKPEMIEALYALNGHLLYTDGTHIILQASEYESALFETLPPTDHDTWEAQRAQLAPYENQRRDPADLKSWLDAFPGPRSDIRGASLTNLRRIDHGFRFELSLEPDYRITGPDMLGLAGIPPGDYLVKNQGEEYTITSLTPPQLSLEVRQPSEDSNTASAWANLRNSGLADALDLSLVTEMVDGQVVLSELTRQPVAILGGQAIQMLVENPQAHKNGLALRLRLEDGNGRTLVETTLPEIRSKNNPDLARRILDLSTSGGYRPVWLLGLALIATIPLVVLRRHRIAVSRRIPNEERYL